MSRLCECGCGQPTPLARQSSTARGWVKGQPIRFLPHHHPRGRRAADSSRWKGGRVKLGGYVAVYTPSHPRASKAGYVFEHILVVERALGKYLPETAVVHHADEVRANNAPTNLVACQDRAYHNLLHRRLRALLACGDANAQRCYYCGGYDRQEDIRDHGRRGTPGGVHVDCRARSNKLGSARRRNRLELERIAREDEMDAVSNDVNRMSVYR